MVEEFLFVIFITLSRTCGNEMKFLMSRKLLGTSPIKANFLHFPFDT